MPTAVAAQAIVEGWVLEFTGKGVEHLDGRVFEVAGLLDKLGTEPNQVRDRVAFVRQRLAFATAVIRWCPSVERLGRWLIRVSGWFGVRNLPGYLRKACGHGDPSTVLDSHAKNRLARAAERWRDFSSASERSLTGKYVEGVTKLVAAGALALVVEDEPERVYLRAEMKLYIEQHRPAAARAVLLKLVGADRSEVGIERAIAGVITLAHAKRLLGVA